MSNKKDICTDEIGVIFVDNTGVIKSINSVTEQITGYKTSNVIGKNFQDIYHLKVYSVDGEKAVSSMVHTLKNGKEFKNSDVLLVAQDGTLHQVAESSAPVLDSIGNLVGAILTFTEKRYDGEDADIFKHTLNEILQIVPCQIFIKDAYDNFRYKVVSRDFLEYYKISKSDIIDKTDAEIFDADVAEQLTKNDSKVCSVVGETFMFYEDISFQKNRKEVFKSFKVCFETDEHHRYLLGICVDVTDYSIMQKELSDALVMANNANALKGKFLSTVNHELRTPLNAIIGFSALLADKNLSIEQQDDYLNAITVSSNSLLHLVNNVLDISKLESHKIEIKLLPIDINKSFQELKIIFNHKLTKKSILLNIESNVSASLMLDGNKIRQIGLNLLGNAIKFTNDGSITLKLNYQNNILEIIIADTGCGISEEKLPIIFEPFVQDKSTNNSQEKGTGLGLAIAKGLVEAMNGTITVASKVGIGTTFTVKIPCSVASEVQRDEVITDVLAIAGKKVLIVDDVLLNLKVLEAMLKKLGHQVISASSAQQALEQLDIELPDLILTDMWMPEINGVELAHKIRENKNLDNLPLYLVTADSDNNEDYDTSIFNGVLQKPITFAILNKILS